MVQNKGGQTNDVIAGSPNHILVIVFTPRRKENILNVKDFKVILDKTVRLLVVLTLNP